MQKEIKEKNLINEARLIEDFMIKRTNENGR